MIEFTPDRPELLFRREGTDFHLDVRPMLAAGEHPYEAIMACVRQIDGEDRLLLHALFKPSPLLRQLHQMGMTATTEQLDEEHWVVTITAP